MVSALVSNSISSPWIPSRDLDVKSIFNAITCKVHDFVTSPKTQVIVGLGFGVATHKCYGPLVVRITSYLGITNLPPDPLMSMHVAAKILLTPFACVVIPIVEEILFRGVLQDSLKTLFKGYYLRAGLSSSMATLAARVSSVFFSSVIFGLCHFVNALTFECNPIFFVPQVLNAIIAGFVLGVAKEFSGHIYLPSGVHIGNNTFAWLHSIYSGV